MVINFAHLQTQGVDFAVFDADATSHRDSDRAALLEQLTGKARSGGLRIMKSALAFQENGQLKFYGDRDLVAFLVNNPYFQWTHTLTV
jgi:hypothetical protein